MSDRYAVVGNPIKHSKSPQIHSRFAAMLGQKLSYQTMLVESGEFEAEAQRFFAEGGSGLNVTVPFKQQAWSLASELSDRARLAGAVNTLFLSRQGLICGDNTDGVGMVRDLEINHGTRLKGKRILILGAGGAVRGVLAPVLATEPQSLTIVNRTAEKAEQLAEDFSHLGCVTGSGYCQLQGRFDLVINGTSASLQGELPPLPEDLLASGAWCYDMMYAARSTPFMVWAEAHGGKALDGLGMLVEQAAESFLIWRGVRPDTAPVIAEIRGQLVST
ncbi:shikimate dehydrogenase [Motiliproteus sp. MSK22-1]|uniref:shikimate dehydrogenase n=1 Tax=Motiliproteus sp. MSK22-1 TaxID=1897630 RepID=UPI0009767D1D|nr:shikimate dehydrogenase [Motiliproteus sp. MSK22-1]OMH39470.1 shikimate dehydrogenase [Motiliproteus sp. MSK22-1]